MHAGLIALIVVAWAILGYVTIFLVEYTDPNSHWDKGVPWIMMVGWPVVALMGALFAIFWLVEKGVQSASNKSILNPIETAQRLHAHREARKRVIIKGKRGVSDG